MGSPAGSAASPGGQALAGSFREGRVDGHRSLWLWLGGQLLRPRQVLGFEGTARTKAGGGSVSQGSPGTEAHPEGP